MSQKGAQRAMSSPAMDGVVIEDKNYVPLVETASGKLYAVDKLFADLNIKEFSEQLACLDADDKVVGYRYLVNDRHVSGVNLSFSCWHCTDRANIIANAMDSKAAKPSYEQTKTRCSAGYIMPMGSNCKCPSVAILRCSKFSFGALPERNIAVTLDEPVKLSPPVDGTLLEAPFTIEKGRTLVYKDKRYEITQYC